MIQLKPQAATELPCKCCSAVAWLYGVVDFHKNCEDRRAKVLELSGIPIYYHRCRTCGFIFTAAFDSFTRDDFAKSIYNDQYALVDPDYATFRPQNNARLVAQLLGDDKSLRVLDYGGGNGTLAKMLREMGYTLAETYDPFVPESSKRPEGLFDCIVSFEVFEHSPDPRGTIGDLLSLLKDPGIVFFSTLFQPAQIDQMDVGWWYIAPRNGHVSIYSPQSMVHLAQALKFNFGSFNENLHVMYRNPPEFAKKFLGAK